MYFTQATEAIAHAHTRTEHQKYGCNIITPKQTNKKKNLLIVYL